MANRTTKKDLEQIVERLNRMTDAELMLRASGGGGGTSPTYALEYPADMGGRKSVIRAKGAGRMERALRGFEQGLRF